MTRPPENPLPASALTPLFQDADPQREDLIREVASIYPFVPGKYGIDFASLIHQAVDFREDPIECVSASGRKMFIEIGKVCFPDALYDAVTIRRKGKERDGQLVLEAGLNLSEDNTLTFKIITKSKILKRRDPDFFAAQFMKIAIDYFERIRGNEVKRVKGIWEPWSDNYKDFFKSYNKEGRDKEYQQKGQRTLLEAARNTWTARILAGLGFDQIDDVQMFQGLNYLSLRGHQIYSYIEATFTRKGQS